MVNTVSSEKAVSKVFVRKMIFECIFVALCVILPVSSHLIKSIPNPGMVLLPMHLPVLICGLYLGWQWGLICGILGPVFSFLFTGMPMLPMLPSMILELALYGAVAGLMMKAVHTGKNILDLYISLVAAMLLGRVVSGIFQALIFSAGSYSMNAWFASYFSNCIPGIIILLVAAPVLSLLLIKTKLLPDKYSK